MSLLLFTLLTASLVAVVTGLAVAALGLFLPLRSNSVVRWVVLALIAGACFIGGFSFLPAIVAEGAIDEIGTFEATEMAEKTGQLAGWLRTPPMLRPTCETVDERFCEIEQNEPLMATGLSYVIGLFLFGVLPAAISMVMGWFLLSRTMSQPD